MQAVFDSNRQSIVVLGMGGTIAGEGGDPSQTLTYQAGARSRRRGVRSLGSQLPKLTARIFIGPIGGTWLDGSCTGWINPP